MHLKYYFNEFIIRSWQHEYLLIIQYFATLSLNSVYIITQLKSKIHEKVFFDSESGYGIGNP